MDAELVPHFLSILVSLFVSANNTDHAGVGYTSGRNDMLIGRSATWRVFTSMAHDIGGRIMCLTVCRGLLAIGLYSHLRVRRL